MTRPSDYLAAVALIDPASPLTTWTPTGLAGRFAAEYGRPITLTAARRHLASAARHGLLIRLPGTTDAFMVELQTAKDLPPDRPRERATKRRSGR